MKEQHQDPPLSAKQFASVKARDKRGRKAASKLGGVSAVDLKHLADAEEEMLELGKDEHKRFLDLYWTVRAKAGVRPSVDGAMAILAAEAAEKYGTDRAAWRKA